MGEAEGRQQHRPRRLQTAPKQRQGEGPDDTRRARPERVGSREQAERFFGLALSPYRRI